MRTRTLALALVAIVAAADVCAQPVSSRGSISSQGGTVTLALAGNTTAEVSISGTFQAWFMATGWQDAGCTANGKLLKMVNAYNGRMLTVSNTVDKFILAPLDGINCVQVQIYGATASGYGYASGTIAVDLSATAGPGPLLLPFGAHNMGIGTFANTGSIMLSTRTACSYPASPCSPPASGSVNALNTLTLYSEISQVVCVYRINVTAQGAPWSGTIRIVDGSDGVALDFGTHVIAHDGPAWERSGAPLFCGDGGNNVMIETSAAVGAATTIYAVAGR